MARQIVSNRANPTRHDCDAQERFEHREANPKWEPPATVVAPGAFAMPGGLALSDFAELAHCLLETGGEEVIHTIFRSFYRHRGVKSAKGQNGGRILLLAEGSRALQPLRMAWRFATPLRQSVERQCRRGRRRCASTGLAGARATRNHGGVGMPAESHNRPRSSFG